MCSLRKMMAYISKEVNSVTYQSVVGSLLYAAIVIHPDVVYTVGVVSKFCLQLTKAHLIAVKRILHCLKGTQNLAIKLQKSHVALVMHTGLVT